ncbi:MAG: hypothetical protein WAV02_19185 [Stellaceae bacterium]
MKQLALLCVALAFAVGGTTATASAQQPDYSKLADAIKNSFFTNEGANAGNDWCYAIEADPNETVWSFAASDGWSYPHVIDYAARIRLVFPAVNADYSPINDAAGNRVTNTASLFMGFDLMKNSTYNNLDIKILEQAKILEQEKKRHASPPTINPAGKVNIPETSPSTCPKLSAMLGSIFLRYMSADWTPQGDPSCDDLAGQCTFVNLANPATGAGTPYISRQTSVDNIGTFSTWTFNGVTHKIPRAIRFLVEYKGSAAYFTIGFGGSGGAG